MMKYRNILFTLALLPLAAWGQEPVDGTLREPQGTEAINATTRAVLLANRPKDMPEAEWLQLMANPENRALFPLRVTRAMLDTLDGREMDLGFRYMLVEDAQGPLQETRRE